MKRFFVAAVTILLLPLADQSQAQMVQVSPGYVRAPFVRVYRTPGGGVNVRAPFVNVYSGGRPRPVQGSYPPGSGIGQSSTQNFSTMSWQSLRSSIRSAATQLEQDLNRQPNADAWKRHLQVAAIRELVSAEDQPPTAATVDPLRRILKAYSSARANPDYDSITSRSSFRRLHSALDEYLKSPVTRQLRRLAASNRQLQQELARLQNGAGWQQYLALPPSVVSETELSPTQPAPIVEVVPLEELQEVRERFDVVSQNADYQAISSLSGFRATHESLASILDAREPTPAEPESLPPPLPIR